MTLEEFKNKPTDSVLRIDIDYKNLSDQVYRDLNLLTCSFKLNIENVPEDKLDSLQKIIKKKLDKNYLT